MKKFTQYLMLMLLMLAPLSLASCSDDKDKAEPATASLVGTWEQTNSAGTVIDVTFSRNGTGSVFYTFVSGSTQTEFFEYTTKVDSDNDQYVYITSDDCQLTGNYEVKITPNTLTLIGYTNGSYGTFVFKRIK